MACKPDSRAPGRSPAEPPAPAGSVAALTLAAVVAAAAIALAGFLPGRMAAGASSAEAPAAGIRFACPAARLPQVEREMEAYLGELGIPRGTVAKRSEPWRGQLTYVLATPPWDTNTLDLTWRAEYGILPDNVSLPGEGGPQRVATVSRREIVLALLQHGRLTELAGEACSVGALRDLVGVRQNIVAWAERLEWTWPDGGPAAWNPAYWDEGTPVPGHSLQDALMDIFLHQDRYAFGCYTATKIVVAQGMLDYYRRVSPDPGKLHWAEARLLADGEPLADIEPGAMWSFEADADPRELARPGKLLRLQHGVAAGNFVPGDWAYLVNTDPASRQKIGYEGSNAIYLGRGRFDDYYNDHHHAYTFREKLDEVYQWRHGVFSRIRDAAKRRPLTALAVVRLSATPDWGGLLLDVRAVPVGPPAD